MSQPSSPSPERDPASPATELHQANAPPACEPCPTGDPETLNQGPAPAPPAQLGRYRIVAQLGAGGFGVVYKGRDDELRRDVAIKVPHRERLARLEDAEAYLAEARNLAALDHPGIVPVHDVGRTEDGLCFLVSKFVEGRDLMHLLREGRPSPAEAADIIARAAEALHHAHQRHLIHRDIKPANILLDRHGHPIVADFGLALSEEDFGKGGGFAGTPAYMSPEQARGEGHRVDARTDVYSLGVVLYELLTGRRPFGSADLEELLEAIRTQEPRPPRQVDDRVPRELDRICLKCLAKRAADRYSTALDLAEDLRHWLSNAERGTRSAEREEMSSALPAPRSALRIVPKGLRSFDAGDADFFLELLPGPRDRDGLPESLRFWKTRLEETDAERTFPVGLLFGPSGCGKSSLVKAGLLPRLAGHVLPIYIEATAQDTETRLLKGLRKHVPDLPAGLADSLAALRRGRGLPAGRKLLLVLDQFEQWLHARRGEEETELVRALRQCDGERVQAIVMVRDDFWMAATRFLHALEFPLLEGQNSATVDLFDLRHARKVLTAFGRAFGALPEAPAELPAEADHFVAQAIAGLAQDGKVISVRLALFAEMMKGRPWTPAALREVGGTAGVGVTFLEETFSAATAPPEHRYYQHAARAVLQALLPERGTDIKGRMRSQQELQERAGYADRPRDWERLLHLLDRELRLVTPTDPEGQTEGPFSREPRASALARGSRLNAGDAGHYYQLTHDYLVPALREWLTRKQRETRRGRAELCLAERAAAWSAKPESRQLPSLGEWARIALLTRRRDWTPPQRRMMGRAGRFHGLRVALVVAVAALVGWGSWEGIGTLRAAALVRALTVAETADVPKLVEEIGPYRRWADPRLEALAAEADAGSKERLHAALALVPIDSGQVDYLAGRLLTARPEEVMVVREALRGQGAEMAERFWQVLAERQADGGRKLRAAAALAALDPDGPRWAEHASVIGGALVRENVLLAAKWAEALRPVRGRLVLPLVALFRDASRPEAERGLATDLLAAYAADRPEVLADVLLEADAKAYAVLYPLLAAHREKAISLLESELDRTAQHDWKDAPLDPAWTAPSAALRRQVEGAQGLLAERFALCQSLPLAEFDALAEGLRRGGYRPTHLRPYAAGKEVRVAAVWTRDGRDWQALHGLSADKTPPRKGLQIADVAAYLEAGAERYAMLWEPATPGDKPRYYLGIPGPQHQADGWGPLRAAKLQPRTLQVLIGPDGEARYSAIWRTSAVPGTSVLDNDEASFAAQDLEHGLLVDVCLSASRQATRDAHVKTVARQALAWLAGAPWAGLAAHLGNPLPPWPEWSYAGTFLKTAGFDHAQALSLTPEEQLRRSRQLAEQGYRPVALSVTASGAQVLTASVWHRPAIPEEAKERLAKRQASAAVALLRLGQPERVWPLLQHHPDPRLRSYLVHHVGPLGADARALARRLLEEPDVSARRALLLCLAEPGPGELSPAGRARLLPALLSLYRDDPDPGLHAVVDWLLRQWGQEATLREIDRALTKRDQETAAHGVLPAGGRRWYVNGQGQTLALIPGPVEFVMGSPRGEEGREGGAEGIIEMQHHRRIGRSFALATREVTVEQFLRFQESHTYHKGFSPSPGHPVNGVSWYDAAEYCNWLSAQEGIAEEQWCYVKNAQGQYANGMRMRPDYLQLTGYRLPTEAEWEYACRAGAATSRYFGESEELLGRYVWYAKNSLEKNMLPPGSLRPNDLGMFDMLGNAYEWCQDGLFLYTPGVRGGPVEDLGNPNDIRIITDEPGRALRGGSLVYQSWIVRSAYRFRNAPAIRNIVLGVRPARTFR